MLSRVIHCQHKFSSCFHAILVAIAFLAFGSLTCDATFADESWSVFENTVRPFMAKYCISCHGDKDAEGEVRLNAFQDAVALNKGMPALIKSRKMLRNRTMPPKDEPRPSEEELKPVLAWLEAYTTKVDLSAPRDPGHVTIRRLNRAEYNNTIRDLLAIDFRPADAFPADEAGYGFDNNGDVLSIAPVLLDKYLDAAGLALDKAIFVQPSVPPPTKRWDASTAEGTLPKSDTKEAPPPGAFGRSILKGRVFPYSAEIYADHEFPATGTYELRLRAYGTQGSANRQRPSVAFKIDNEMVGRPTTVKEDQRNTSDYSIGKLKIEAGSHRIELAFLNGATQEEAETAEAAAKAAKEAQPAEATPPPPPLEAQAGKGKGGFNRRPAPVLSPTGKPTLGVIAFEVEGPLEPSIDRMPESYQRIFIASPSASVSAEQAAEKNIRNFARKAFRRPVRDEEVQRLLTFWKEMNASGESFQQSIHDVLQAALVSPHFLYRVEKDPTSNDPNGVRTLDEFELASRLSYFLWSTMPDEELMQLAEAGELRANLDAQVQRMLKSPKSFALVENFAGQWLQLRQLENIAPDAKKFPNFDDGLRTAMLKETQLFFASIVAEDRNVLDFIDANYTYLNERLAKHYGVEEISGDEFRKVQLSGNRRGGLLTQASVLTITSYPNRTSPVQRGKWVLENLLDSPPPPPPADVPKLEEGEQAEITGTLRQRLEQHRANANCAACHAPMDPIGFGLENFDAIGAWREKDVNDQPIDASGALPDGQSFKGPAELKQIIKAQKDQFCRCLTDRMLTFALGRGLESFDRPTTEIILQSMQQKDYRFSVLITEIVKSDPFQKRGIKRGEQ